MPETISFAPALQKSAIDHQGSFCQALVVHIYPEKNYFISHIKDAGFKPSALA